MIACSIRSATKPTLVFEAREFFFGIQASWHRPSIYPDNLLVDKKKRKER